ncbi:MAG: hypothetical protein ACFB9M_18315 [Myxococcota bacterium]
MATIPEVLDRMRADIEGCYFTICFETDSGLSVGVSSIEFRNDTDTIGAAFGQVLDIITRGQKYGRNDMIREALHEFKELILETSLSTFLVLVPEASSGLAIGVGMPKDSKIGYARVAVAKHKDALLQSIRDIG